MAEHMTAVTAEQLRAALLKLAEVASLMDPEKNEDAKRADHLDSELRRLAARLSGMAAVPEGPPAEFVVRQHLKHAAGGLFVDVWKTSVERAAMDCYRTYISDFPHQYFEVLRITHREDCLAHNGKPQFAAPEPPHG